MPTPNLPSPIAVEEIFRAAAALPAAERAAYLEATCEGQPAVRARVERMLEVGGIAALLQKGGNETVPPEFEAELARLKPEDGGERIGNYKLLQQIGQGGFGIVWMAEQIEPVRRRVALKIIKLGMDTKEVIARFEQERQALAMMDHPNIAKVFDAGVTSTGRPFFVMELVRGIKITEYCDQANLSTAERLALFIAVCQAVQHAHQKGIIHRDLKLSNILVTLHDGVPVPKVIDFGVAKATQSERLTDLTFFTQFEQMIGTPLYMSPEQAEMSGLDIDTRSDIYSLGVLLYELLTGRTPFDPQELMRKGVDEIRRAIREQEPPKPSTALHTMAAAARTTIAQHRQADGAKLIGLISGDLDWIIMKCLEKDRTRRYETANGLAADLKRHLDNEPVVARPPSAAYRLQKAWRRNKLVFTAGAAVFAALVAGLALAAIGWRQTRVERDKALQAKTQAEASQRETEKSRRAEEQQRQRAVHGETEALRLLYVATMSPAQQAWEQNNVGLLRQLLDETKESRSRGFEWYYWQRQLHLDLTTLRGHLEAVSSVAFSPDGQRILTGSRDATAKVWEAASGKELLTLKGHGAQIRSVAFSPDGQRIVTGSVDQTAKVWEATSGLVLLTLKGHEAQIRSVAFSPDGQRIVTGSLDKTAKVWAAAGGREPLNLNRHSGVVRSVAFSPDGLRIVTGSLDKTAKVWAAASGQELLTIKGASSPVAFSPDGRRIVTGSGARMAKVWEAASGRELLTLKGNIGGISSVAFSPDGQRIVTGNGDQTAKVWEAADGRELLTLRGHSQGIGSAAFSPDGQRIVTGSWDATAKVWEAASGKELLTLKGHEAQIWSVAFSPDGERIVTGSRDATAKVWEAASGKELLTLKGHEAQIWSVAFSPDGQRIVTGSLDKTAKVWEAATAIQVAAWQAEEHAAEQRLALLRPEAEAEAKAAAETRSREIAALAGAPELAPQHKPPMQERPVIPGDPGVIRQWLVLAPFPFEGGADLNVLKQQIPNEARLHPRAGERPPEAPAGLAWTSVQLDETFYRLDFVDLVNKALPGSDIFHQVAYAVAYVRSEKTQTGLMLLVGSDDTARIYLNEKEIYRQLSPTNWGLDCDEVSGVELKAGLNVIVFKVANGGGPWGGSVRFIDAAGQPVKGIKVALDPEATD